MRRLLVLAAAVFTVAAAALLSSARPEKDTVPADARFGVTTEGKNPWTSLAPNTAAEQFQFAVVSDRTGGHRPKVFSKAVQQINLLQPEFVMSVGDLIEGSPDAAVNRKQWDEFDGYVKQFAMPFFYCPGNHDAQGLAKTQVWGERLGRPYYSFTYKNCLFVVLNTNEPSGVGADGNPTWKGEKVGKQQVEWLGETLKANAGVRWTFVFLHHPIWVTKNLTENGWLDAETVLAGRKYTLFCGHLHQFRKYLRNGTAYYQLATTGGGSALRGAEEYGEFDQIAWVTVRADGPVIANVALDGIYRDDLRPIETAETGRANAGAAELAEVVGKVTLDGNPGAGLAVLFTEIKPAGADPARKPLTGNARVRADGSFEIVQNRGAAGLKPGRYAVTLNMAQPLVVPKEPAESVVPEKYRALNTTPLRVEVKAGERNTFAFDLQP